MRPFWFRMYRGVMGGGGEPLGPIAWGTRTVAIHPDTIQPLAHPLGTFKIKMNTRYISARSTSGK